MWTNPKCINLDTPFVYYISITDHAGNGYRYVGQAKQHWGRQRLGKYKTNLRRIRDRKPHASNTKYRAVHFALYKAIKNSWKIDFYPYESCSQSELNHVENRLKIELDCNLNGGRMWKIEDICTETLEKLLT